MIPDLQAMSKQLSEHFSNIDTTLQSLSGYVSKEETIYLRAHLAATQHLISLHVAQANARQMAVGMVRKAFKGET